MGGSHWSDIAYNATVTSKVTTHGTAFDYDADVKSGKVDTKAHDTLDPKKIKGVRESRDSDAHPLSNAIVVALDVTGSMAKVVSTIHSKLPSLMGLLTRKNYIVDPQVMFMAIGDATCDNVPLQVGQFESGVEMEDNVSKMYLEQGGGGQNTESYELGAYIGARKTSIDCFEKRNKKGYFFFIGDELPYSRVDRSQVKSVIGDSLQSDVSINDIFTELKEKYNVFFVLPQDASNGGSDVIANRWKELVGDEHVLKLPKAEGIAELIAMQIGLVEGSTDVDSAAADLEENGASTAIVKAVTDSISKAYTGGSGIATVDGGSVGTGKGKTNLTRL